MSLKVPPSSIPSLGQTLGLPDGALEACIRDLPGLVSRCPKRKPSGSMRRVYAPRDPLHDIQQRILHKLLRPIEHSSELHGSVVGRNPKTNVTPHVGAFVSISMDITDFYPSISKARVNRIWIDLGYSRRVAQALTHLTTFDQHLAQGFPPSSDIANIVLEQDLLPRLRPLCSQHHLTLTMYQDDLTISGGARLRSLGNLIQRILLQSGYPVDKTRISNPGQRHMSTGLVYNTKPNIPKERYRALRGELHRCLTNGVITEAVDRPIWQYKHHLASRIEHVRYHNPSRANNLQIVFDRIDWGI